VDSMSEKKSYYQMEEGLMALKRKLDDILASGGGENQREAVRLREDMEKEWEKIRPGLTPLHIVQIARHPRRPYTLDYIHSLTEDFMEIHGDRRAKDDPAVVAGFGFYRGRTTAFIGHQKGRSTRERIARNFGQPNPEGYRKALRVMKLAEKFGFPVITLIDTPGAFPGIEAEERGQAEAIATNLKEISRLKVPVVNVVIGEGGSGGALGVGVGDVLLMLEHSFYSVISPEGCAAILWKEQTAVDRAAENLKFLSRDLMEFGIADEVIPEPPGGAHVDPEAVFKSVDRHLQKALKKLERLSPEDRIQRRYQKFRRIGVFTTHE